MTNETPKRIIRLAFDLTPLQQARLAIDAICRDPEFMPNYMIGGTTPPAMLAENGRKAERRHQRILETIAKFGVFDEYLKPLREELALHEEKAAAARKDIADIEALRPKP